MKTLLAWLLWLWLGIAIVAAYVLAPPMSGFSRPRPTPK
jgi:hypothetical protein